MQNELDQKERLSLDGTLTVLAFLGAFIVAVMVVGIVTTHSSQEYFQSARTAVDFQQHIAANPEGAFGLRLNLALDDAFLVVYTSFFVFLALRLRPLVHNWILLVATGAMILAAALDALENHHIIEMLHSIENNLPLPVDASQLQMILSNLKFHATYLACFLFAFGLVKLGTLGRWIGWILRVGYLPFGFLLAVYPADAATPLALARTAFFVVAFVLSGILFASDRMAASKKQ